MTTNNMRLIHGDCLEVLRTLPDNSVDSCVTDPPYGLSREPDIREVLTKWLSGEPYDHGHGGFMGKAWDSFVPHPDIWREVYRVLKPGGHALVFAGTRTQDLMTISLRLAGFEVRDVIEWLYFSGFPKSMDVSKAFDKRAGVEREVIGFDEIAAKRTPAISTNAYGDYKGQTGDITAPATELARKWDGWGTALKPAHEPIIVVRKPLVGTVADNVEKYGTGAVNIDGCRIAFDGDKPKETSNQNIRNNAYKSDNSDRERDTTYVPAESGRFPANIVTTDSDAFYSKYSNVTPAELSKKASKRDRNSDWRGEEITLEPRIIERESPLAAAENRTTARSNYHPTVKPVDLMAWLVRLVTPPNGTVLDPFAGSGSTLVAARREGFGFIGIELTDEYIPIIEARTGVVSESIADESEVA